MSGIDVIVEAAEAAIASAREGESMSEQLARVLGEELDSTETGKLISICAMQYDISFMTAMAIKGNTKSAHIYALGALAVTWMDVGKQFGFAEAERMPR